MEEREGEPFSGNTGKEVRKELWRRGLDPLIYFDNVCRCRPPMKSDGSEGDPLPEEIDSCAKYTEELIAEIKPELVICAGRFSARYFLNRDDFTMEMVTGVPYRVPDRDFIVLPMIHPASGFHSQKNLSYVMNAYRVAEKVMAGEIEIEELPDYPFIPDYRIAETVEDLDQYLWPNVQLFALDTEAGADGYPWSIQLSQDHNTAVMVLCNNKPVLNHLRDFIHNENPLLIIHSALYDIPELAKVNIHPKNITDTMIMAYLLQDEPLGLKSLAWRQGMKMNSYTEVIYNARKSSAIHYLETAHEMDWPDPPPIVEYKGGIPTIKNPQNIAKKAKRILGDVAKGKRLKDGQLVCPRERWYKIGEDEGRGMVEEVLGPMPDGFLSDIPLHDAVLYGCSDADATLRVYYYLKARIKTEKLSECLDTEIDVTRFVNMMHQEGMPADKSHFQWLAEKYERRMGELEWEIIDSVPGIDSIQLSSHQQVSSMLYDKDKLNLSKHLPKKLGKKSGKTKTGDAILAQIEPYHPVIGIIREYRKWEKALTTYARGVPKHIRDDNRIHANFRTTNTPTGRLSCSDPNLMAMPKRWDGAKEFRNGFHAPPGMVMISMDYSQIELRILSEESGDEFMIRAFLDGIDLHSGTALEMFHGMVLADMSKNKILEMIPRVDEQRERLPTKSINFGIVYGITADGLYRLMATVKGCEHWTKGLAQSYIDKYFELRPGIKDYINNTLIMARRYGKVWDWSGRIRRIPGIRLVSNYNRAEAERQACNAVIQMGAQSVIKKAMADLLPVYIDYRNKGYKLSPVIQIHDDIVSFVDEDIVDEIIPLQKQIMESAHSLRAGIKVDVEWGVRWGEMYDWTAPPT